MSLTIKPASADWTVVGLHLLVRVQQEGNGRGGRGDKGFWKVLGARGCMYDDEGPH
jgi:hypothetical protein